MFRKCVGIILKFKEKNNKFNKILSTFKEYYLSRKKCAGQKMVYV